MITIWLCISNPRQGVCTFLNELFSDLGGGGGRGRGVLICCSDYEVLHKVNI